MIRFRRPRFLQGTLGLIILGAALLLIGGGMVFAKFGGAPAQSSANDINLQKGLVGWWPMNGSSTSMTPDATPYANNGTVISAALTTDRKGKANSAYSFNGSSSYIDVGTAAVLTPTSTITVSAWINGSTITNTGNNVTGIVCKDVSGSIGNPPYCLYAIGTGANDGKLCWTITNSSNTNALICTTTFGPLSNNTWYHVVGTYDGNLMQIFLNGTRIQTSTGVVTGAIANTTGTLKIGRQKAGFANRFFTGKIDDVRIYNRVLSAAEVTALYSQYDSAVKTDNGENGLAGWWKLDGNAKDATPYANDGTIHGTTTLVADRESANNSAYSFSGSDYITTAKTTPYNSSYVSVSAWVYLSADSASQTAVSRYGSSPQNGDWLFGEGGNGQYRFSIYQGGALQNAYSTTNFALNAWHLLTGVYDGSNVRLYVDGVNVTTTPYGGTLSTSTDTVAIAGREDGTFKWHGKLDDVRVYSRALSAGDVASLYNSYNPQISLGGSGQAGSVSLGKGLIDYWPMNDNNNATIKDATPYSNNGTVTGVTPTTDRKGRANSAYSFNGSGGYMSTANAANNPQIFSINIWFSTTTTSGGGLVSFDDAQTGNANNWDRVVWLNNNGKVNFGDNYLNSVITSAGSYNDGNWHQVTATISGSGMVLYVDGVSVGTNANTISQSFTGWWRIGNERLNGFQPNVTSNYFSGSIDDTRIYNRALSAAEVAALYRQYQ